MKPGWIAAVAFLLGCAVSVALWRYWTPRCNETCAAWLGLSMQGYAFLFPLACAGVGAGLGQASGSTKTRLIGGLVFTGVAAALALWLTQSAG